MEYKPLASAMVDPEAVPENVMIAPGTRAFPLMLKVVVEVAVKLTPVTAAPLTNSTRLEGVNAVLVKDGVIV